MSSAHEELIPRERDDDMEQRERLRYEVLVGVYERGWPDSGEPVRALDVGVALGIPREDLFRTVVDLTHRSFLSFCAAGPRVRITEKGAEYVERLARRRRSIRDF